MQDKIQEGDPKADLNIATQDHTRIDKINKHVDDYELLKELGMLEKTETVELADLWEGLKKVGSIENHAPEGDIYFEEKLIGDLSRPHLTFASLTKWEAIVPRRSNSAYAFNDIIELKKYKEIPYMLKLMASTR